MWDRKEAKEFGKERFKNNYWKSVLAALVLTFCSTGITLITSNVQDDGTAEITTLWGTEVSTSFLYIYTIIMGLLFLFVFNPLIVGCYGFFKDNVRKNSELNVLSSGFSNYGHVVSTMLLMNVYTMLWSMLLFIPGIIKGCYSYRMVPFILRDNPTMTADEVITRSRQMMYGHKMDMFLFDLSYIGWYLLGLATFGLVAVFWTKPYKENANAYIYTILSAENPVR